MYSRHRFPLDAMKNVASSTYDNEARYPAERYRQKVLCHGCRAAYRFHPYGRRLILKFVDRGSLNADVGDSKMRFYWFEHNQKPLRLFGRLKPLHAPSSLPSWLMLVLGTVV